MTGRPEKLLLHVFSSFSYGGQQARLAMLARALGPDFRHHIVALDGDLAARSLFDASVKADFTPMQMKKSPGLSPSNILRLRRCISGTVPDLLCTYNWGSIEAVVANRLGVKAAHIHFEDGFGPDETLDKQSQKRVRARRFILAKSHVVVPSQGLEQAARTSWKLRHVHCIENGVDFERMQSGRRGHSAALVVGSLGALRPEKNYARLIAAFKKADREHKARLEIFGGGPEHDRLCALAGDDERISLPGATSAAADAYARFDIFALSSDTEQAPISLMEAMAAGLPVVATNVGDIAAMVSEENRAYVTLAGDDDAYADALAQLLQNPGVRAETGAANKRKAKETFSLERMAAAHRTLYLSVMERHG
ncbi:glycosyltransferase family 4 protein [Hyphococcus sp.]|uniref:glycosyltransferase family 4 protein n=1 Tax=Hyphococcus sp. TaxID=2038636 RepID=UPI003D1496FF